MRFASHRLVALCGLAVALPHLPSTDAKQFLNYANLRDLDRRQTGASQKGAQNLPFAGPYSGNTPSPQDCQSLSSSCKELPSDMTRDAESVASKEYDYIIIGAGNAGLVVANRLTENPHTSVLVVESGDDTRDLINVYKANETYAINNVPGGPVFQYFTTPQINDSIKEEWYGKGLGGSTTVNGQVWDAPHHSQVDDIGRLGNDGWNWQTLLKYYKKAQDYHKPSADLEQRFGIVYDEKSHRSGGPVTIAHLPMTFSGPPQIAFVKAVKSLLGINQGDLQSGNNNAMGFVPQTLYPNTDLRRVSSATSYYNPISGKRPNFKVLLTWSAIKLQTGSAPVAATVGANSVTKVGQNEADDSPMKRAANSSHNKTSDVHINSVVIQNKRGGKTVTLKAKRFILSAGTVKSPFILEHSGIGDKKILTNIGAKQVVDLPGVGKMFSEQTQTGLNADVLNQTWRGMGASGSIAQPSAQQLFANHTAMEAYVVKNLDAWAQQQVEAGAAVTKAAVLKQYKLMTQGIFHNDVPINENFFGNGFYGNKSALSMSVYTLTPYAKGWSHANTSDPWDVPAVNPRYWQVPFDMDIEVASLRAGKKLFNTTDLLKVQPPRNSSSTALYTSSPDCTPDCKIGSTDEYAFFRSHIIQNFGILDHAVGTCIMMPREDGGVVDARFNVYGVSNLRVVDASVLPMPISAHPQATVYAIAEYASDLIKADDGLSS